MKPRARRPNRPATVPASTGNPLGELVAADSLPVAGASVGLGTIALFLSRFLCALISFFTSITLARSLGKASFGTLALGFALAQMGTSVADFGLNPLFIRESDANPVVERSLFSWAQRARVVGGALVAVLFSVAVLATVDTTSGRMANLVILASIPVMGLSVGLGVLQRRLRLLELSGLYLLQTCSWLLVVLALSWSRSSPVAFAAGFLASTVLFVSVIHALARRELGPSGMSLSFAEFRQTMRGALAVGVAGLLVTAYYKIDSVLVFELAGAGPAGAYAVAYRFVDQLQIIPITLSAVMFPLFSARAAGRRPLQPVFERYVRVTLLTCAPAVCLGVILAEPLILISYGDEFADAVPLLRLLLPAFIFIALGYTVTTVALVAHRARVQLAVACLALVLNLLLNVALIPRFGAGAAAVVTFLTEVVVVVGLFLGVRRFAELRLPWIWLARLAAVTAAAFGGAMLSPPSPLWRSVAFAVTYAGLLLASGVVTKDDAAFLSRASVTDKLRG